MMGVSVAIGIHEYIAMGRIVELKDYYQDGFNVEKATLYNV